MKKVLTFTIAAVIALGMSSGTYAYTVSSMPVSSAKAATSAGIQARLLQRLSRIKDFHTANPCATLPQSIQARCLARFSNLTTSAIAPSSATIMKTDNTSSSWSMHKESVNGNAKSTIDITTSGTPGTVTVQEGNGSMQVHQQSTTTSTNGNATVHTESHVEVHTSN